MDKIKDQKRALLVIDVQNEYFNGLLPVTYPNNSFENILEAINFSNEENIIVVVIQHTSIHKDAKTFLKGTNGWELHDKIKNAKYNHYIEKTLPSSFVDTNLQNYLQENNIDTVVISGYMTQMCCDTTARYAMHLGYNVEFLSDATGTLDIENAGGKVSAKELHTSILVSQAMRFSKVLSLKEWKDNIR